MKLYDSPMMQLVLLGTDVLMASDENQLVLDKLSSIFNL